MVKRVEGWYHISESSEPISCHKCLLLDPGTLATLPSLGRLSGHLVRSDTQQSLAWHSPFILTWNSPR